MELSLKRILRIFWKRWAVLLLALIVGGGAAFAYSSFCVAPQYTSSVLLYVQPKKAGSSATSAADLSFARSLIDTYTVVLKSRPVLDEVVAATDLGYSSEQIGAMVSASAIDETEMFRVTVTCENPHHAQLIANAIGTYGVPKVAEIVGAGSANVIESALLPSEPSSPNPVRSAAVGAMVGFLLVAIVVVGAEVLDRRLRDVAECSRRLNIPLLGTVEDYSVLTGKGADRR